MRFLFTTIPGSGHFHPLVPTARALQLRGHDVAFAASPMFAPSIETAGFEAHPAGPVTFKTWFSAVRTDRRRRVATSLFVWPSAMRAVVLDLTTAGTYAYWCSIPGHRATMEGTLTVGAS